MLSPPTHVYIIETKRGCGFWDLAAVYPMDLLADTAEVLLTCGPLGIGAFGPGDAAGVAYASVERIGDGRSFVLLVDPSTILTGKDAWSRSEAGFRDAQKAECYFRSLPRPDIEVVIGY